MAALTDKVLEFAAEGLQVGNLAHYLLQVLTRHTVDRVTGLAPVIGQLEQIAHLV